MEEFSLNQTITAAGAPAAVGPYCHAKRCGNTLYASGQLGLIPETGAGSRIRRRYAGGKR